VHDVGHLIEGAFLCHDRGWSIIPIGSNKKPPRGYRWKQFQQRQPTEAELAAAPWSQATGFAVILGAVSGGLACRDFDNEGAYCTWATRQPMLARDLPTVRTGRGHHVYFRGPDGFANYEDGEYRANAGHYCVLPPSWHSNGKLYEWLVQLPAGKLPEVDPVAVGLRGPGVLRGRTKTHRNFAGADLVIGDTSLVKADRFDGLTPESWIQATLPTGPGQRHRRLFDLARMLKGPRTLGQCPASALMPIVREWFKRALPVIRTKDWTITWQDFCHAWDAIEHPVGAGPSGALLVAWEKTIIAPSSSKEAALLALCQNLAGGDGHFWLSCRDAAGVLGCGRDLAAKLLRKLCSDGVLALVKQGTFRSRQATCYQIARTQRLMLLNALCPRYP
jgi:hypothetical protein